MTVPMKMDKMNPVHVLCIIALLHFYGFRWGWQEIRTILSIERSHFSLIIKCLRCLAHRRDLLINRCFHGNCSDKLSTSYNSQISDTPCQEHGHELSTFSSYSNRNNYGLFEQLHPTTQICGTDCQEDASMATTILMFFCPQKLRLLSLTL